jgi:hypothetical protein
MVSEKIRPALAFWKVEDASLDDKAIDAPSIFRCCELEAAAVTFGILQPDCSKTRVEDNITLKSVEDPEKERTGAPDMI